MAAFYLIFLTLKFATILSILYKLTHISRHKLMGSLSFLISICSLLGFCNRVLLAFLGILVMDSASNSSALMNSFNDFGCGFLTFGGFSGVSVVLFLVISGFRFLQLSELGTKLGFLSKSLRRACFHDDHGECNGVKNSAFECEPNKMNRVLCRCCEDRKFEENSAVFSSKSRGFHEEESKFEEIGDEDEVFDVMTLRKMVKIEKRKAKAAHKELNKERMAASSSVDETMAMILRLQNEKSGLQIKVNQLERSAQEKKLHDQDVIQSLQWIIMKHESERELLQGQLRLCKEKLWVFIEDDEWNRFECLCPTPGAPGNA